MQIPLHLLYFHILHLEWVKKLTPSPYPFTKIIIVFHMSFAGIGTLDVALVPLLASIVDSKYIYDDDDSVISSHGSPYGGIYAIQQIRLNFTINFHFHNDICSQGCY